jgi:hypothetical protein
MPPKRDHKEEKVYKALDLLKKQPWYIYKRSLL